MMWPHQCEVWSNWRPWSRVVCVVTTADRVLLRGVDVSEGGGLYRGVVCLDVDVNVLQRPQWSTTSRAATVTTAGEKDSQGKCIYPKREETEGKREKR